MSAAGDVDLPGLRRYIQWIAVQGRAGPRGQQLGPAGSGGKSNGPVALAVTADTAEVAHLSHGEQLRIVEEAKGASGLPCIAGLTATSTARAVTRAQDLRRAGADALLVFPSPAFVGARERVVLEYHRAVGEVGLPLIAFQLQPSLGGVLYPPDLLRRVIEDEAVVAIKEASFDRDRFRAVAAIVAEVDGVTLLTGNDNFTLESFELGAEGALLGFGAVMTSAQVDMIEAWRDGRVSEARALAARLQPLADAVFAAPVGDYRARLKECLVMDGVLSGAHVRPPLLAIGDEDRARLSAALRQAQKVEVPA